MIWLTWRHDGSKSHAGAARQANEREDHIKHEKLCIKVCNSATLKGDGAAILGTKSMEPTPASSAPTEGRVTFFMTLQI